MVPVAVATLTPFPLLTALVYYNLRARFLKPETEAGAEKDILKDKDKELSVSLVDCKEDSNRNIKEGEGIMA